MHCKFLTIFCAIVILVMTVQVNAQQNRTNNGYKLGLQLSEHQNDFGTGITLTSPWFAKNNIAVRMRGNVMFHEHLQNQETTWSPYINSTLGVTGKTDTLTDIIQLYGESGIIGLFPNKDFHRNLLSSAGTVFLDSNFS